MDEWRLQRAEQHLAELHQIMQPESVQVAQAIIGYLSSYPFMTLVILVMLYRAATRYMDRH
jgi:hypothetical protein